MNTIAIQQGSITQLLKTKLADYIQLIKLRLSLLVVFSAAMAYLWVCNNVSPSVMLLLSLGGFMITGAANILNQVIERDSDKLMKRTEKRPLPEGRLKVGEALILAFLLGVSGLVLLGQINSLCAILGAIAIFIYAGIYTPLKKITHLVVVPGAIAGSLPVVIGCIAATGGFSTAAWLLFSIQFIWQFPHTWSIAWLLSDEYDKPKIKMMPMKGGRTKRAALSIFVSSFFLVPCGLLLYMFHSASIIEAVLITIIGGGMVYFGYKLYAKREAKSSLGLMFASFGYLPLVLIVLVIAKFI